MGKQGPCYHCGVTSTPLWRNGPPEKPILCNACGSRWRTKGSLANYTPLHARADFVDSNDYKISKPKSTPNKKEPKSNKRKYFEVSMEGNGEASHTDENFKQLLEEEASTRSSSDSAISYSESHAYLCNADGSDMTGTSQSVVWETLVPSKKRTCVSRSKASSVEKLTKDLCSILHEQQQSVQFSLSSEEDLLFESGSPLDSFEIGHGGCLIKFINSNYREEESEASSVSVYSKNHRVAESRAGSQSLVSPKCKEPTIPNIGVGMLKNLNSEAWQESAKRNKLPEEKISVLNRNSPLASVDLRVIVNYEEFLRHLNCEEQEQLKKYLPSSDTSNLPDSLKCIFDTPQFLENLSSFQQLLRQGVFDMPCAGDANTNYRSLRKLLLSNLTKSKWIEHFQMNKVPKQKEVISSGEQTKGATFVRSGNSLPLQRTLEDRNHNFIEPQPHFSNLNRKSMNADKAAPCVNGRNVLALSKDGMSSIVGSFQFSAESSDQDLLVDIPSNAPIPEAELLSCQQWKVLSTNGTEDSTSVEIPSKESSFKKSLAV